MSVEDFSDLSKKKPEKKLVGSLKKSGGRNNHGRITSFHRGGGHKRRYRKIDFRRDKLGIPARVASLEYDPNRSARIALLHYADGEKRYILAPLGLAVGDELMAGERAEIRPGNSLPLSVIPLGTVIHNIELKPGQGWAAGALGWRGRAAHGARGQVCERQAALERDSTRPADLHSNGRAGR